MFYAVGTAIGGITGPLLFAQLVSSGSYTEVFWGYLLGAALMVAGGLVEAFLGLDVAGKGLEEIAKPLTATDGPDAQAESAGPGTARARRRQYGLGPGERPAGWSRQPLTSTPAATDSSLEGEIAKLVRTLSTEGPLTRSRLAQAAGAKYWGPGRFSRALRAGICQGRIRRLARNRYDAA
jgi:hypothetical protein